MYLCAPIDVHELVAEAQFQCLVLHTGHRGVQVAVVVRVLKVGPEPCALGYCTQAFLDVERHRVEIRVVYLRARV